MLVDPFFTRPSIPALIFRRLRPMETRVAAYVGDGDDVLITHSHYDHLMDVPLVQRITGCTVHGSPNSLAILRASGVPENSLRGLARGAELSLEPFQVGVLPGGHLQIFGGVPMAGHLRRDIRPPLRLTDYRVDVCHNFLFMTADIRLLLWNGPSTAEAPRADVLVLQPYFDTTSYRHLLDVVEPRCVVAIHWDDFTRPLSQPLKPILRLPKLRRPWPRRMDMARFRGRIEALRGHVEVLIPEILKPYDLREVLSNAARAQPAGGREGSISRPHWN